MSVNPYKLKKDELLVYVTKRCKHGHRYHEHPHCFVTELKYEQKVGFLDIETNGFFANFHIIGSYCIKVAKDSKIYGRTITQKELRNKTLDKPLIEELIADMLKFDVLVTYNGIYFDMPFIRTRALKHDLDEFPVYGMVKHVDVYFMARSKLRLHRKSMHVVSQHLNIPGKTHVIGDKWIKAFIQGDKKSLDEIFDHNKQDVIVLEKVYNKLRHYTRETKKSL